MGLDSGLTVLVCSIFFVFLALLKQNVLIFVSQNLDKRSVLKADQKALFSAYDLDQNGIIDQDEFYNIAKRLLPDEEPVPPEPELNQIYLDVEIKYSGDSHLRAISKKVTFREEHFKSFIPDTATLGNSWDLYSAHQTIAGQYFAYPVRPTHPTFPLHSIFSHIHWNPLFKTRYLPAGGSAIVTALSDSHVRVNFIVTVEYQLKHPPSSPTWLVPCNPHPEKQCGAQGGDGEGEATCNICPLIGEVILSLDSSTLERFEIRCGCKEAGGEVEVRSIGGSYQYKIQQNMLTALPVGTREGLSYSWYSELEDWQSVLVESDSSD